MATITEDYVSFEIAKLLKEKEFNEVCNRVYQDSNLKYTNFPISPLMSLGELGGFHPRQLYVTNNELGDMVYTAPTLQMAMKWLRDIHNLDIIAPPQFDNSKWTYSAIIFKLSIPCTETRLNDNKYKKEEACETAIKYCLEHLI